MRKCVVVALGGLSLPAMLFSLLSGAMFGTGTYALYYGEGSSYLSNDPRTCVNCHIMRDNYDSWQKSSHHAVAVCNDCHAPHDFFGKYLTKVENGFWHSTAFTLGISRDPLVIRDRNSRVLQGTCLQCHADVVAETSAHAEAGNIGAGSCVHCHLSVGHGSTE